MKVDVENRQNTLSFNLASIAPLVEAVLGQEGKTCDEVCVHFVNTEEIIQLHSEFFNDPTPTDCISFPIDGVKSDRSGYCMLGDVFVCTDVAKEYAEEHHEVPLEELTLYVVHGLLHLMGYDDIEEIDRKAMRDAEKRQMRYLKTHCLIIRCD